MPLLGAPSSTPMPWARLSNNATLVLASSGTPSQLTIDTVNAVGNGWSGLTVGTGQALTSIVAPFTGHLQIEVGDMDWGDASNGVGDRRIGFRNTTVGAGSTRQFDIRPPTLAAAAIQTVSSWVHTTNITAGQSFAIMVTQTSGGNLSIACASIYVRYLEIGSAPWTVGANIY